jgi:aldose 1-epimerase
MVPALAGQIAAMAVMTLRAGELSLGVEPDKGASLAFFRHGALSLLRETPAGATDERDYAALPLIPFSNRIRGAQFAFGGVNYTIARDAEDPRHALHGTARFYPWAVVAQSEHTLGFQLDYTPQNFDWPFAYRATQTFRLRPDGLHVRMRIENTGTVPAPAGLGWHPYFVRVPGTALNFDARYVWEKDAQDIPDHSVPDEGRFDFGVTHALDEVAIDNDYGGWGGRLRITAPGRPQLRVSAGPVFTHLVLFTPQGKPYLATEPVSHRPDAIHPNGDARDEGMAVLAPGEALEGTIDVELVPA